MAHELLHWSIAAKQKNGEKEYWVKMNDVPMNAKCYNKNRANVHIHWRIEISLWARKYYMPLELCAENWHF